MADPTKTDICNLALSLIADEASQLTDVDTDANKISRQCLLHYDRTLEEVTRMHTWNCAKKRVSLATSDIGDNPTTITIFGAGDTTWNLDQLFVDELNDAPRYSDTGGTSSTKITYFTGSEWRMDDDGGGTEYTNPSTALTVPQIGWVVSAAAAPAPEVNLNHTYGWTNVSVLPEGSIRPIALDNNSRYYRYLTFNIDWAIEGRNVLSNNGSNFLTYETIPTIAQMDALFLQAFYTQLAIKICNPITNDRAIRQELMGEFQFIMMEARRVNGFEGYERPVVDSEWLEATVIPSTGGSTTWQALSVGDIPMT